MAYVKPGVEIKQVQQSSSPVLNPASLPSAIIGNGYFVQNLTDAVDENGDLLVYSGSSLTVDFANISSVSGTLDIGSDDQDLIICDLAGLSGPNAGKTVHLVEAEDFTASSSGIAINAYASMGSTAAGTNGINVGDDSSTWNVKVSWRSLRDKHSIGANEYKVYNGLDAIRNGIGEPVSHNPLAYGLKIAMDNSGTATGGYLISDDSPADANDLLSALSDLESSDAYAIAPMSQYADAATWKAEAEAQSLPTRKKEKIVILNNETSSTGNIWGNGGTEDKNSVATAVRDQDAVGSKRVVVTHPDLAYVEETRHVTSLKLSWIEKSFKGYTSKTSFTSFKAPARFASTTVVGSNTYYYWDQITDDVWDQLIANNIHELTAFVPVPGFYYCAQIAGLSQGQPASQPFTNLTHAGIARTWGSADHFSDAQLDVMATSGKYILSQKSVSSPIVSRHAMTTNVSSVPKRELSITRAVDYSAKFIRQGLEPYIGVNVISPQFLKLFNSVLVAQGLFLVREGILNDFKVSGVKTDDAAPDTILADVEILPKYPVNYIKIQLIF